MEIKLTRAVQIFNSTFNKQNNHSEYSLFAEYLADSNSVNLRILTDDLPIEMSFSNYELFPTGWGVSEERYENFCKAVLEMLNNGVWGLFDDCYCTALMYLSELKSKTDFEAALSPEGTTMRNKALITDLQVKNQLPILPQELHSTYMQLSRCAWDMKPFEDQIESLLNEFCVSQNPQCVDYLIFHLEGLDIEPDEYDEYLIECYRVFHKNFLNVRRHIIGFASDEQLSHFDSLLEKTKVLTVRK